MDPLALTVANRLLGNAPGAPALELTGAGVELAFVATTTFALAGADLGALLDGRPLPRVAVATAAAGQRLLLARRLRGARTMFALPGGVDAPVVLGSAATDVGAGFGGLGGGPLIKGTRLAARAGAVELAPLPPGALEAMARELVYAYADPFTLRFVPEPDGSIPSDVRAHFLDRRFRVSSRSNRAGYRFEGPRLAVLADPDRLSEPTAPGAIQLPPDGLPILLMADRNTTGGYPRLGHLASADRPKAAQLWPGDEVRFAAISVNQAAALAGSGQ
jgi:biotin-dependent carboxylase-like uncharacterized protein